MGSKGKALSMVMLITVLSKCFGFVRDMILAHYFGASIVSDAYFIAQTIPEFLFSLAVQAVSIGFIPIYTEIVHDKGFKRAIQFTDNLYCLGWILVIILIVLVYAFTDAIVRLFASGFTRDAIDMTGVFVRISVWGMFFRITSSIYTSFLHANDSFVVPALIGIPLDIVVIIAIYLAYYFDKPVILAASIGCGYLVQMLIQMPFVKRIKPRTKIVGLSLSDPYLRRMTDLFLPVAIGVGASQINLLVDRTMASSIEGAISSLNYANKVCNILENIIVLSLATIVFPIFSKRVAKKEYEELSHDIGNSLMIVLVLMLPCAIFAFQYAYEVIELLFGHGVFDSNDVGLTANAMQYYSLGVLFVSFNAILTRVLYSLKKVKYVSFAACISMVINVALNLLLAPRYGVRGLAIATSIANMVQTCVLGIILSRQIELSLFYTYRYDIFKCIVSSITLGIVNVALYGGINRYTDLCFIISCIIAVTISIIVYWHVALWLQIDTVVSFNRKMQKAFSGFRNHLR